VLSGSLNLRDATVIIAPSAWADFSSSLYLYGTSTLYNQGTLSVIPGASDWYFNNPEVRFINQGWFYNAQGNGNWWISGATGSVYNVGKFETTTSCDIRVNFYHCDGNIKITMEEGAFYFPEVSTNYEFCMYGDLDVDIDTGYTGLEDTSSGNAVSWSTSVYPTLPAIFTPIVIVGSESHTSPLPDTPYLLYGCLDESSGYLKVYHNTQPTNCVSLITNVVCTPCLGLPDNTDYEVEPYPNHGSYVPPGTPPGGVTPPPPGGVTPPPPGGVTPPPPGGVTPPPPGGVTPPPPGGVPPPVTPVTPPSSGASSLVFSIFVMLFARMAYYLF